MDREDDYDDDGDFFFVPEGELEEFNEIERLLLAMVTLAKYLRPDIDLEKSYQYIWETEMKTGIDQENLAQLGDLIDDTSDPRNVPQ